MPAPDAIVGREITEPDDDLGVKQSPVFDYVIVDSRAWDDSDEPQQWLTRLSPGDTILFRGEEARVSSLGKRSNFGQRGLYQLGFDADVVGTTASLYVDRDPYLLDITNGPIQVVDPSEVKPLAE